MMLIRISDKQWQIVTASTSEEIYQGLRRISYIPPYTGMLFCLPYGTTHITIDMSEMLLPIDIVFFDSNLNVIGILNHVSPYDDAVFIAEGDDRIRYFLEVNAGEAKNVSVGDTMHYVVTGEAAIEGAGNGIFGTIFLAALCVIILPFLADLIKSEKD